MPYLVTTKRPTDRGFSLSEEPVHLVSRVAVGTLEEARQTVVHAVGCHPSLAGTAHAEGARIATEAGGTVGPLPDGSLIEVAPKTWGELVGAIRSAGRSCGPADGEILAAFNEANR